MKLALKKQAIDLRKKGKTYSEIQKTLGQIPKSTLSGWLKNIELSSMQKQRILQKMENAADIGRQKGGWTNHLKRINRIDGIKKEARVEFGKFKNDPLFFAGLTLFLAEGSKKTEHFQFMNSDFNLIKIMMRWLNKFTATPNENMIFRLYTHSIFLEEKYEEAWSKKLNVPLSQFYKTVYKPTSHQLKKNDDYKGCLRLEVGGSKIYWKIIQWRDNMYNTVR